MSMKSVKQRNPERTSGHKLIITARAGISSIVCFSETFLGSNSAPDAFKDLLLQDAGRHYA